MIGQSALLLSGVVFLASASLPVAAQITGPVTAPDDQPKHPAHAAGPRHSAEGVIRDVTCRYPSVIEFHLEGGKKPLTVYNNNFARIDLSVLGFTPSGSMNPCKDFEGHKARIQYAESSDTSVDGEVVAVELKK